MSNVFNVVEFRRTTKAAIRSQANLAPNAAKAAFNSSKREMLEEFNNHPVTKEIEEGPDGGNISETLGGYGSLFSFIGFPAHSEPTAVIRKSLEQSNMDLNPIIEERQTSVLFKFPVHHPSLDDIEAETKYPQDWQGGSWVAGIEQGIPGLRYFLYKTGIIPGSRSGPGIQRKEGVTVRGQESFTPIKYLSTILEKFKKSFL